MPSPSSNAHAEPNPTKASGRSGRVDKTQGGASTRDRILTAAERLFAAHGFGGVSMPDIAKASGITAGAIYKHFDSKADLFFEIVRGAVRSAPAPTTLEGNAPDMTMLARQVAAYTTQALKPVRQLAVEIHVASSRHPRVRRLLRQSLDHSIEQIRQGVAGAQQTGDLDPNIDPELLASAAMVFIMGLMHMESLLPKLVGDPKWREFVEGRFAALMGLH